MLARGRPNSDFLNDDDFAFLRIIYAHFSKLFMHTLLVLQLFLYAVLVWF